MFNTFDSTQVLVRDRQRSLRQDARHRRLLRSIRRSHHRTNPTRPLG